MEYRIGDEKRVHGIAVQDSIRFYAFTAVIGSLEYEKRMVNFGM